MIAFGISAILVIGVVVTIAGSSLVLGAIEWLLGKPKLTILKNTDSADTFSFAFKWNEAKEPASFDCVKIRLFNPFGNPAQLEAFTTFPKENSSFAKSVKMGPSYLKILENKSLDKGFVQVELVASKDGISYQYDMNPQRFFKLLEDATKTVSDYTTEAKKEVESAGPQIKYGIQPRNMVADTVPGKGPQLKIPTNPAFAGDFAAAGAGAAAGDAGAAKENFSVSKVWIEPGCIVCNACEDIYPEVFDVQADTCLIRPGAPLNDGLKIEEAAEACPVEVIKFNKA